MFGEDMMNHAEAYAAFVLERYAQAQKITPDAIIQIETKLNLTDYVPEGFGTGDAIIIADGVLEIIDLKYGKGVQVSCVKNKQMMLYALGAFQESSFLYDIHTIRMSIFQPRLDNISSWELPVEELIKWSREELIPIAALAFEGKGDFCPGDHCRFCRARIRCKALADQNMTVARYEFKEGQLLSDREVSAILSCSSDIKKWLSAVEEYALIEARDNGKIWEGFKLVEGRSVRTYSDPDTVASTLIDAGYPEEIIYQRSLLGITAMEKAITKKKFTELLNDLIAKPQGLPTLVPLSDKRPALSSSESAKHDFSNN